MIAEVIVLALVASTQASSLTPEQAAYLSAVEEQLDDIQKYVPIIESLAETPKLTMFREDNLSSLEREISKMVEQSAARVTKQANELHKKGKDVSTCLDQYSKRAEERRREMAELAEKLVDYVVEDMQSSAAQVETVLSLAEAYREQVEQEAAVVTEDNYAKANAILKQVRYYASGAKDLHDRMIQLTKEMEQAAQSIDQGLEDGGFPKLEKEAAACMRQ